MMDTAALLAEERAFQSSKRKDVPTGVRPQASEEEETVPRQEVRIPLSLDVLRLAAAKQDSRAPLRALLDELAEKHCRPRSPAFGFELGDYNNDDNEKGLRINWPAVILKLHRAVLASPFVDVLRQHRKSSIRTVPMSFSRDDDGGPQPEQRKKLFAVPALEREAILQRQSSSTLETRLSTDPRSDTMLAPAVSIPTVTPAPTPTTPVRDVALQRTLLEDVPTFTSAETAARPMPTSPVAPVLLPSTPPPSPVAAPGGIVQLAPPVADRSSGLAPFPVPPPSPQHQQQQQQQQQQQLSLSPLPGLASAPSAASMQGQTVSFESYNIPAVAKNEPQKEKKPKRVRENPFVRARVAVLPSTVFGAPKDREETVDSSADLSLAAAPPAWADFVVYWGGRREDAPPADACAIPLQWILLALNGRHAHDVLLEAYVTQAAFARLQSDASAAAPMKEAANRVLQEQAQHPYLRVIEPATLHARMLQAVKQYQANRFTKGRFNDLLSRLVDAQTPAASAKLLREVEDSLQLMQAAGDHSSLQRLERVLISLLGHEHKEAREFAVVLLNVLYDGHDWQRNTAFKPVIRCVGDAFMVDVEVPAGIVDKQLWIQTSAPSTIAGSPHYVITHTPVRLEGRRVYVELPTFHRSGYYDWRLVSLSSELTFAVVDAKLQGRVIAQPALRTEIMHEVWVELEGAQWDWSGRRVKHGDFRSLANAIDSYRKSGVTCTYVMGALDRITGAQPFCPIDRSVPNKSLGGEAAFREVVAKARQAGVKLLVDATTRISAKGANRKYNALVAHALDENGNRRVIAGTDGLEFDWHDSVQINYRKKAAWDLLVAEMLEWANKGVDGVRLDSAHSWPLILRPNTVELLRLDSDGQHHYTPTEILEGEVAMPRRDEARTYGYYGTEAAKTYANPLFLKITREIWAMHPHFIFIAETHWNREVNAIVSGLVPYTAGLPRALASVYRKSLNKDGSITELPQKCSVRVLYDWYELERRNYPENALILYPSSTHFVPYPTTLYDWSAWAAVDLLYFLPEIPITFIGEHFGWRVSVDINSGDFKGYEGEKRQPLQQICGHYDHRCLLRRTHRVLNSGGLIPLFARGTYGWHDRVFAFARFTEEELVIIAINFNDVDSVFYIDCSPLKDIVKDNNVIYRVADHINPANSHQYYTLPELLYGKTYVTLKPWDSLCLGIYQEVVSPSVERTLFEQSLRRLQKAMQDGVDPATNLIYSLALENLGSLRRFKYALDLLASKKLPSFPQLMQNVLYHATRTNIAEEARVLSYLNVACKESSLDPETRTLYDAILSYNTLGPVVFVTPEIGRFSTVGGIGVMVDDLTLALAALGLDIYIISPYYNFNRKGKTGYLAEEGVKWSQNLVTTVGYDRVEVGVHTGKENGVNLVFLHNFDYFPTPYNSGSAAYQLSTIVLFAKATLEFCCQMRLLPAIVVTNDWFAGLTAAYARYGAFGSTFDGTTFFHLVHNLEEGYEGKIYPDGRDLGYIHQLPRDLLIDPFAPGGAINASRCALMASHQWGTVSKSYRHDLLESSPLKAILRRCPAPFAHSNGLRVGARLAQLAKAAKNHEEAKLMVQRKYFPGAEDPSIPIFSFVGRLTLQKGVHLILNSVRELVQAFNGKIQILVGGQANMKDPYAAQCAWTMQGLRRQFPKNFWADPNEFFTDGVLLSLGCDFGLMPSLFEPSGIVQQEYFSAGTPVIAFKTGGLKDTVFEFLPGMDASGNGFTFEAHTVGDYIYAVKRAMAVYSNPQQYAQLRTNAQRSVLDTAIVAEAWTREFCRLRHRMWADPSAVEKETQRVQLALSTDEAQWPKEESRTGSAVPPFIPRPPGVSAPPPSSPGPISREVSIESSGVKP